MTTMNETIALLSGMAPKEPEQWAVDEWSKKFYADYPPPESDILKLIALDDARAAVLRANGMIDYYMAMHPIIDRVFCLHPWYRHKMSCRQDFEKQWPIIWARKRLELVNEIYKG